MAIYHMTTRAGKAHTGQAVRHGEYIRRDGLYADRNDMAHHEHGNMPSWAKDKPDEFWKACDELERANGRAYREIEVALPRELDRNQQIELVRNYVREQLGERHAYEWSLHDKCDGNPHAHIMFSERRQDHIERDRDLYFRRANPKNPERGGCTKDDGWRGTKFAKPERLLEARTRWADLQNIHLDRAGELVRVDHRRLVEQGVDRAPQIHVGYCDPSRPEIHAARAGRNQAIKEANRVPELRREAETAAKELREAARELRAAKRVRAMVQQQKVGIANIRKQAAEWRRQGELAQQQAIATEMALKLEQERQERERREQEREARKERQRDRDPGMER